jgi:hypothetical protein
MVGGHRRGAMGSLTIDGAGSIPIFENPKIREGKKAGYNRTNIFKRSEPIRLWVGSTAMTLDVEIKFTLPHMETLGGAGIVAAAVETARKSVEPRGSKGPGTAQLTMFGALVTYPPCIITDYELDASYDQGAYGHDSRVIILRLKMEEYHGI